MNDSDFLACGAQNLRVLSDRERSKVHIVRCDGKLQVLKFERPTSGTVTPDLLKRQARLQELSRGPGLLPILAHGATASGWLWQMLPLGNNLPGLPDLQTETGVQQYTPLTLRTRTQELGPATAIQIAAWGQRLCSALSLLHQSGLVHRDVNPSNIIFLDGTPRLGDYGLVGEPGTQPDFCGTEGFQPLEGTNDPGADLFALGRALYEAWTGRDRLEFPSLPKALLLDPDWQKHGMGLNELILRSDGGRNRHRFASAEEFGKALLDVEIGKMPVNRRVWLKVTIGAGLAAATGLTILSRNRPDHALKWERVRDSGFLVENWAGNVWTVDWSQRFMHSLGNINHAIGLKAMGQSVNLDTFEVIPTRVQSVSRQVIAVAWDPARKFLICSSNGKGPMYSWKPGEGELTHLGGGQPSLEHFEAMPYWNQFTARAGILSGYGKFQVRNDRWEFDIQRKEWIQMEPHDLNRPFWPRAGIIALQCPGRRGDNHLYFIGGLGSPTGKQGKEEPDLAGFNGLFHVLDDLWSVNLETGIWQRLIKPGTLRPNRAALLFHHPTLRALVIVLRHEPNAKKAGHTQALLLKLNRPEHLHELEMVGTPSTLGSVSGYGIDPRDGRLLVLANDGIFKISI